MVVVLTRDDYAWMSLCLFRLVTLGDLLTVRSISIKG